MNNNDDYLISVPVDLFIALTELACDGVAHGALCDKQRRLAIRKLEEAGKILEEIAKED